MCGIAGIFHIDGSHQDHDLLKRMTDSIRHRGPDDEGYYTDGNIGLGHRRLSIIDLSPAGHQPMSNEDGSAWITYNGEVYNYLELMEELKEKGHKFKSKTDTEVIIHAYEEWGEGCLSRFNGMFAFAIWDNKIKRLFCARDRFGIKPFYYFYDGKRFIFASEIKALLEDRSIERRPNNQIVYDFLVQAYLDHTDETFFEGIKQIPPSHYLIIDAGGIQIKRWWDIDETRKLTPIDDKKVAGMFYELFEDSIRLRLRSDVPVGTCLSGGLDSSSIVCVANRLMFGEDMTNRISNRQKTFSSCFDMEGYDERRYINGVLAKTGAEANFVFPRGEDLFDIISDVIWHQDEPFGSTSIVAQWYVMKEASKKVKVLLDGQGADELLAGYHGYFGALYSDLLEKVSLLKLLKEVIYYKRHHKQFQPHVFSNIARSFMPPYLVSILRRRIKGDIGWLDADFQKRYRKTFCFTDKFSSKLDNLLYNLLGRYGLPALLHYEDRNSMAFSIEARVPFLDYRLVEFMFSLPADQKLRKGTTKIVLRNAMKEILPEEVRTRQDKMGFVTPEDIWFRTVAKEKILGIFNSMSFQGRGYFNVGQIKKEFDAHLSGKKNISNAIWRWINIELWFRRFFDK
mgnify:CR=1 FL=1